MNIKTLFLKSLIFLPSLNVFTVNISDSNYEVMQSRKPSWFEEVITIKHNGNKTAIKDGHYKWHMSLNRSDLNIPTNAQSLQITGLDFNFKLWFKVFKKWYDANSVTLDEDQLIKATTMIQNKHPLNIWVEGKNDFIFGGLNIKTGIQEIPSAYYEHNYSDGAHKYNIYDFSTKVSYKYLLDDNGNRNRVIEYLNNFFKKEHDLNLSTLHTGVDLLQRIKTKFERTLSSKFLNDLEVHIINRSPDDYNKEDKDKWSLKITFNNEIISSKADEENAPFLIKLKNIHNIDKKGREILEMLKSNEGNIWGPQGYKFNVYNILRNYKKIFKEALESFLSEELLNAFDDIFTISLEPRQNNHSITINIYLKNLNILIRKVVVEENN